MQGRRPHGHHCGSLELAGRARHCLPRGPHQGEAAAVPALGGAGVGVGAAMASMITPAPPHLTLETDSMPAPASPPRASTCHRRPPAHTARSPRSWMNRRSVPCPPHPQAHQESPGSVCSSLQENPNTAEQL